MNENNNYPCLFTKPHFIKTKCNEDWLGKASNTPPSDQSTPKADCAKQHNYMWIRLDK
ncbi:MAG: hypothetical protein J7M10_05995 [Candidatus Cloacimonetes bacterium]|nr:hypothetical protein [Candidatus Cloacimonadota bacterium]